MFAANSIIAFIFCVILVDSQRLKEFDECDGIVYGFYYYLCFFYDIHPAYVKPVRNP